jgi:hypothetical protein
LNDSSSALALVELLLEFRDLRRRLGPQQRQFAGSRVDANTPYSE